MAPGGCLLLALLLLAGTAQGQHWSHGWYPGGKRDLSAPPWLVPSRGRKSRHDPPAKSKASRLKVPPPVDPAELYVITERYRQHRLVLSALRSVFRSEVVQRKREAQRVAEDSAALSEEHRLLMAWNDAENARQRARR
uniref:Progonadoliberin n=1 Tax=Pavo cristatus TaxID=9049 RepID=A0A8C9F0W6_PAVCR